MWAAFIALKQAGSEFIEDDCMSSGAAIAYYSIFALPPLLVIVFLVASYAGVDASEINRVAKEQLGLPSSGALAPGTGSENSDASTDGAEPASERSQTQRSTAEESEGQLKSLADRARSELLGGVGTLGRILGVVLLVFTATGLFAQLQVALNRAWQVEPDPEQGGVKRFVIKRLLSLGMILVMAFLLLTSMVVSAFITEIIDFVRGASPDMAIRAASVILDNALTFAMAALLFAAMYKVLPDAEIAWRDTLFGACFTALMFLLGKAVVAWYLGRANLGATWGDAAGSLVAVLAWMYYTSLIVLFGAELTQVWARRYGGGIRPEEGAIRAVREKRLERDEGA